MMRTMLSGVKERIIVNAVVVTYNRLDLLKKTIEKLKAQSKSINKIIIIDNASTDGTTEYLTSINDDQIIYKVLEQNLGGAGGFYYGIKEAYDIGCDYLWIMDDDTICTDTALDNLLDAALLISKNPARKIGFLSSDVRFTNDQPCLMNIPATASIYNEFISEGIVQVTHTSFVAMLIPSIVVKDVGLPIKEYFIWGDDGEYSTRILGKYLGYLVGKSVVYHYMKENKGVDIFSTPADRIDRFYFFYRNWMITHKMRSKKATIKYIISNLRLILAIVRSKTGFRKKKICVVLKGMWDGFFMKVKIDYV